MISARFRAGEQQLKSLAVLPATTVAVAELRRDGATWDEVIAETGIRTNSTGFRLLLEEHGFDKYGRAGDRGETKARGWGSASLTKGSSLSEADVEEIEDAADLKFGLERDMQDALRGNIDQLDPSLHIVDEGRERYVEAGRIDILAEDDAGTRVVIELKSGEAPDAAITQLLSYLGSLQAEDDSRPVRGILIARSFSKRVRLAAEAAGIQLVEYGFTFSFSVVGTDGHPVESRPKDSSR
jgi:hypothetical protein